MMTSVTLAEHDQLISSVLGNRSGLHFRFLSGGRIHSVRYGDDFLLNLVLGCPLSGGLQRLYVELESDGQRLVVPVMGPGSTAGFAVGSDQGLWRAVADDITIEARLSINPSRVGWTLDVSADNRGPSRVSWRAFHGLDVGLANVEAVRLNESYVSQYIDHRALNHEEYGKVIASRQNLAVDGKHPLLLQTCLEGCEECASEGQDVFGGAIERSSLLPLRLREGAPPMPGIRQGEMSYVAMLTRRFDLAGGDAGHCRFVGVFTEDHADPSSQETLKLMGRVKSRGAATASVDGALAFERRSLFDAPRVIHGEALSDDEVRVFYPDEWSIEERSPEGTLWSFFAGTDSRHVVTRAKEALMGRPHGTILRSGAGDYPAPEQLSSTCFAAGVFHALLSSGHVSFHRMLSFPRESCGLMAASGQRIWLRDGGGGWSLLGVPSVFEMGLTHARWIYRLPERTVEIVSYVASDSSACGLDVRIIAGEEAAFLLTHGLIGGINEYDAPATLEIDAEMAVAHLRAAADSMWRHRDPVGAFTLRVDDPSCVQAIGGADLLAGGESNHAMLCLRTRIGTGISLTITAVSEIKDGFAGEPWLGMAGSLHFRGKSNGVARLNSVVPWFVHNGMIHFTVPHGIEQYNGGAWGSRDVTQGAVEMLLSFGRFDSCRRVLLDVYRHQYAEGHHWPQWFMLEPFGQIMQPHSHGDIPMWPIKSLCDYLEITSDFAIFDEMVPWTNADGSRSDHRSSLFEHAQANLTWLRDHCIPGTALLRYGDGDWNDSLQPAKPELREHLVSSWSVALCYQVVSRLNEVSRRSGLSFEGLVGFADEIRGDFHDRLIIDDTVCGFCLFDGHGKGTPLLHPSDEMTGIHYRLLPMTRSMIGGLFTSDEAEHHNDLINEHLLAADGARLMDRPPRYRGGKAEMFQRAETSPCFSREIGLFYTHAHLRYIEAMARMGKADAMWEAIGKVNPAGISESVPNALPRQANAYFSSSDAVVATRYEADERYEEIKSGDIPVEGGWRIYSSGPGIFLKVVMGCMVGLRRRYDKVEIDPVVPSSLDGLDVDMPWDGRSLRVTFSVREGQFAPRSVILNGTALEPSGRTENPYRDGGWAIDSAGFDALLQDDGNRLEIQL